VVVKKKREKVETQIGTGQIIGRRRQGKRLYADWRYVSSRANQKGAKKTWAVGEKEGLSEPWRNKGCKQFASRQETKEERSRIEGERGRPGNEKGSK